MSIPGFTPNLPERDTALKVHPRERPNHELYAQQLYDKLMPGQPYPKHWKLPDPPPAPEKPVDAEGYETLKAWVIMNKQAGTTIFREKLGMSKREAIRYMHQLEEDGFLLPAIPGKPREVVPGIVKPGIDVEGMEIIEVKA